jgi:hypothetical protein
MADDSAETIHQRKDLTFGDLKLIAPLAIGAGIVSAGLAVQSALEVAQESRREMTEQRSQDSAVNIQITTQSHTDTTMSGNPSVDTNISTISPAIAPEQKR